MAIQGNRVKDILMTNLAVRAVPTGLRLMLTSFPTLKRGANDRCASGAMEIGARLVKESRLIRLA